MDTPILDESDLGRLRHLLDLLQEDDGCLLPWGFFRELKDLLHADELGAWGLDGRTRYSDDLRARHYEHVIRVCGSGEPGRALRLEAFRGPGPGFSERERFLLMLLRPHVDEAVRLRLRRRLTGPADLTGRQLELLRYVREGETNRRIARRLGISEATVRTHLNHIYVRLGVTSRTAAVRVAAEVLGA